MEHTFQEWALVELFGHNKIAGKVTEHKFGNQSILRVDVPAVGEIPAFTKIVNVSSIYAINPMTEADATDYAKTIKATPVERFDMQAMFQSRIDELVQSGRLMKPELAEIEDDED